MLMVELVINLVYFILALFLPGKIGISNVEITRKISHMICGSWIFIFVFYNRYYLTNIIIMIIMIFLMSISYKYNIFKGVERANQVKSYGTVYFFISLLIFIVIIKLLNLDSKVYIIYFLPLAYGDAFAALIGKKFNWIEYKIFDNKKTVSGNIGMFFVSLLAMYLYNSNIINNYFSISQIILTCIIASIVEAVSVNGTDNFTIPIITMIISKMIF